MPRAVRLVFKSAAVIVLGLVLAFALIGVVALIFGGGIGDPCPPHC